MTDELGTIQELRLKLAEREAHYHRAEKLQTALYEIADAASAVTDMHEFYAKLHSIIGGLMYARNFFIASYDEQSGIMSWPYHEDEKDIDEDTWAPGPYTEDKGVTSYVLRTGKNVHSSADTASLVRSGELEVIGTLPEDAILVPLRADGKTIGVLCVQSYEMGTVYSEQDVQLLTFVSQHVATALTRARAIEETLQRNNELAILNSVGEAMAKTLDVKTVTRIVGDKVRDIFGSEVASIDLLDRQGDVFNPLYTYDRGEGGYVDYVQPYPAGKGLNSRIVQTRKPLLLGTLAEQQALGAYLAPEVLEQGSGVIAESWMGVPIIAADQVLGVVAVADYKQNAFHENDLRLLQTLSASMGIAIQNARLFEAEQQRIAELQIINSIQQGLASKLELEAIIDLVGDKLREVLHTEEIGIRLYDEQADLIHYLYEYEHGERLTILPMKPSALFYEVQQHRLPVFGKTLDISQKYGLINVPGTEVSKSMATVPILAGNKVIGGIAVENYEREDAFNESNVRLMQTIASSMGVALENARLFDETQRLFKAEQQRAAELAIITSVQDGLASKLDMHAIYDLVGDKIREVFDAQVVSIMTYDRAADLLTDRYAFEKDDRTLVPGSMPSFGFRKHVIQTREPLLINREIEKASIEYDNPILYGAMSKSNIFVPMIAGSDVTGVVSVQNLDHEDAFTDSDVGLLQTLANSMSVALENARLFDEVQKSNREISEALEQQKGTGEILRVIAGSPTDIQPVLVAVAEHAARLCQANDVQIYQLDGNTLRQVTHFGPLPALQDGESLPLVPGLVTGRAVLERRTIHVEDMRELSKSDYPESVLLQERLGHRTAVSTPLLREGKAIGAIVVRRNEVSPFTGKQIALLSTFADQAAIAIENVRLFNETTRLLKETEQRAAELSVINSVQQGLASKLDMKAIYDLVGDRISEIFGTEVVYIAIRNANHPDQIDFPYYVDRGRRLPFETYELGQGITSRVIEAGQPVVAGTMQKQLELGGIYQDGEQSQSYLGVPILLGDIVKGVASVQSYRVNAFAEADVRLLSTLAASMGVALENARLFDETQRLLKETEQRAAELAIINSVQEGLASKLDIEAIYDLVGEKIRDIFDAQSIIMATFDRQQRTRHITYNWEKGTRYPGGDLPFNKLTEILIQTRQPVVIEAGTLEEIESFGMVQTSGTEVTKSGVWMPLLAAGQVSGMVSLQNVDREHAFSESDVRLLQTLTSSMGVALENARLFDETQRLLKETEQRNAELAVINSVQGALAAKLDIRAIYDAVGGKVSEIFPNSDVGIRIYDPVANLIHFPYSFEDGKRIEIEPILRSNAGITNHVLNTRVPLLINQDAEEESAKLGSYTIPGTLGEKSALYVPLVVGEQARGLISLIDLNRENAFADSDVRLLTTVANSMSVALENARLFDETQRLLKETEQRAAELAIINSVQEGLASKLDMQAIYDLVGDKIRQVFDAQSVLIDVFDHERQTDRIMYGFESGQRVYDDNEQPFNTLVRHLVSTRQPVTINENALEASRQYGMTTVPGTQSPKSLIFVPFGTAAQVNGHFSLQNIDREHAFSESDVRLLQTLAGSMGIALENARLFKAEQQRAAELSAISAVSQALVAETDLDKMIELIGEKMRDTFSADIAYVALLDRTTNLINFPYAYGDDFPSLPYGEGLTSRIIQTAEPLLINRDIDKRRAELGTQLIGKQAASYLGVPIMAGKQAIGVISVQSTSRENAFDDDDLRLLSTIAANAGAAIRTAQLHTETQRRALEMTTLAEIGNDIASSRELEPVLERIAAHAKTILNVRDIAIALRDSEGNAFRNVVALGQYPEEMKRLTVLPGQGITGHILQSGIAEFVNYPGRDSRVMHVPGTPEQPGLEECLMGAPLASRGEIIGCIMVWREHREGLFTQTELDFLVSVARQTAIAIESARLYLETQRRANEMSALAEVGREISSTLEPAVVLEKIAARARELLAASSSAVFLLNPDKSAMQAITALGELEHEIKADVLRLGEGIIGSLALEGRAEFVNDTSADPRAIQIAGTEEIQQENLMVAPLFRGDEVTGMMAVWRVVDPFNEADLNFLVGLSRQAAIALENARLFEEIKRQGQYLETIFSNSPVAIVTVDETGEVLSWSPAAEKLFAYTREEALGRNVDDLVASSPEVHKEASEYTLHGMDNQYVHRITKRTRKDGTLVDVDLSALPLPLEGGKTGVVAIYNDVGEIQRQRQYYEAIVQNSPVAIVAMDEQSNVVSWNPGAEQLFGYTRDEALGRNIDEMVATTPELRSQAHHYNAQAISQELHVITRRTRKDNSEVEVELSGVPLPLPTGKSGLVAIYHDITELQRARQEAISANEAKSAFLATMSHEIRTPMNAVIGMSGLLMDTQLSKEQHDYAETIRNSGDALLAIINDILDFSKIEAGKMDLERQPFDLRECVESALDLVAGRAVEKNLDLAYIIDDDVPVGISGDVTRLRQILLNLMSNAVKFTARGEVVLTVKRDKLPGRLLFAVRDSGIGIAPDRMGRLFESFSQADSSTTRRFGGTGLGLAISKRLAELMGGAMWVESPGIGKGSTFSFSMAAEPAKVAERKTNRDVKGIQPALQGKRVLIVDDNATNRRILMLQTEKWGMAPRETQSSREALKWLKSGEAFDLVILDVQMPEMDGIMLARELRRLKDRLSLPIILLTSLGRKEAGAEDLSVAAYLTKPLKPSALFDALAGIFARNLITPRAEPAKAVLDTDMARNHPLRILLAEDNAVNQKLALRLLQQMGYRADVASNGLEAVESVERQSYDVVLMDVQMPEMDGLDATRAIRKLKTIWQPRVVAMTANAMQGDREMCIAAGMDDYISKPIRVAELVEALTKTKSEKRASVKPARKAAKKPAKKKALPSHPAKKVVVKKRSGSGGSAVKTPRKTVGTVRRSSAERGSGRRS